VVDDLAQIPLRQIGKNSSFRKDHSQHGMYLLNSAFLSAAHRIAVIDTGPL